MILALTLSFILTAGGALATYLYDDDAPLASRLFAGACIGFAVLGLVGFIGGLLFGLDWATLVLSTAIVALPFALLLNARRRSIIFADVTKSYRDFRHAVLHLERWTMFYLAFYFLVVVVMWLAFANAMFEHDDEIFTGVLNNFGDLPFHLSVITRFVFGQNFPPEDPTYAGVRFTYPFATDLVSAMFVRVGASLRDSMFIENFILAIAFVGVIHYWALRLLRDRLAAVITPLLIVLSGGLGWLVFVNNVIDRQFDLMGLLSKLPHSYTIVPETTWRWGNAMTSLLLTQRGILLGIPLAVIVFTQWWAAGEPRKSELEETKKKKKPKGKTTRPVKVDEGAAVEENASSRFSFFLLSSHRRMLAAGVVAGLLPLVHAHTFIVVMGVGAVLTLERYWRAWLAAVVPLLLAALGYYLGGLSSTSLETIVPLAVVIGTLGVWFMLPRDHKRMWLAFFAAALVIALPQLLWSTHGSAVKAGTFIGWHFGWDSSDEVFFKTRLLGSQFLTGFPMLRSGIIRFLDVVWFWLKNTGVFIPLLVLALVWRRDGRLVSRRLLWFYLPFTLCFVVPNLFKMAPWIWDNVKVLFYWWVASAPLVALAISRLWRGNASRRILAGGLFVALTLAGALDVFALVTGQGAFREFDRDGIQFSELIKQQTPQRAMVLHAPIHNHPVFLTGRRSLMGYPGHIWTHGLEFAKRESDIRQIYSGGPNATRLLASYGVDYVVVSYLETAALPVNESFFAGYTKIGETGGYRLYKVTP